MRLTLCLTPPTAVLACQQIQIALQIGPEDFVDAGVTRNLEEEADTAKPSQSEAWEVSALRHLGESKFLLTYSRPISICKGVWEKKRWLLVPIPLCKVLHEGLLTMPKRSRVICMKSVSMFTRARYCFTRCA